LKRALLKTLKTSTSEKSLKTQLEIIEEVIKENEPLFNQSGPMIIYALEVDTI
jgi:hypothetical protein